MDLVLVAVVYHKAQWTISFLALYYSSVHSFPRCHLVISCRHADDTQLFISFQPDKFSENACHLHTVLNIIAGWMTSNLVCVSEQAKKQYFLYWVSSLRSVKFTMLYLLLVMVFQPLPQPLLVILVSLSILISLACFYHVCDLRRICRVPDFSTAHAIDTF